MVIAEKDQKRSETEGLKGGKGTAHFRELLTKAQLGAHGRLFSVITLAPGDSIGEHRHEGESETYVILEGTGLYGDNGTEVLLGKGDCAFCADGETHFIRNVGDTLLSFIALILYS